MEPLYVIAARAGKDRDALLAMVERFYPGWPITVESLGGVRSPDKAVERVEELLSRHRGSLILYLGGREDLAIVEALMRIPSERFSAVALRKKRVRNARLEEIHWFVEKARAKLRLRLGVAGNRLLVHRASDYDAPWSLVIDEPYADVFPATRGWRLWLQRLGCRRLEGEVVLERLAGGEHLVLSGTTVCRLAIPDRGRPRVLESRVEEGQPWSLDESVAGEVARFYESLSLRLLRWALEEAEEKLSHIDAIVVPWSGGKDSTVALWLAKRAYRDVIAVYVDTGVEFPHTREYIEEAAERLGVELLVEYAGVREALRTQPPPTPENRWCTGMKLDALRKALSRIGERLLVVTGDRDAESEPRSRRPPLRIEEDGHTRRLVAAPLKPWSTLILHYYARLEGLSLNPLYELGFYRIGCYMCPALRSWERMLLSKEPLIAARLVGRPYYRLGRVSQG